MIQIFATQLLFITLFSLIITVVRLTADMLFQQADED